MGQAELQDKIFEFVLAAKGRKVLKEKDVIKGVSAATGETPEYVKKSLRALIDTGCLMYSDAAAITSIEVPTMEYLKEKGLVK
ncbi:MAG: hypothetical protein M0Z52_13100 [Actinomycetota bacterium]|nr:hypothetical protein [Actinomycetota bacterium]